MSETTRDAAWLLDMLAAARAIRTFVADGTFEQYEATVHIPALIALIEPLAPPNSEGQAG